MKRKTKLNEIPAPKKFEMEDVVCGNELATKWNLHPNTLNNWRYKEYGPKFFKFGSRAFYFKTDVAAFEKQFAHVLLEAKLRREAIAA